MDEAEKHTVLHPILITVEIILSVFRAVTQLQLFVLQGFH